MYYFAKNKSGIICIIVLIIATAFLTACGGGSVQTPNSTVSDTDSSMPNTESSAPNNDLDSSDLGETGVQEQGDKQEQADEGEYADVPYENLHLGRARMSDRQLELYDEIYPKILEFEFFSYDVATYGYEGMDDILMVYGGIIEDYPEVNNYFIAEEIFNDEDMLVSIDSKYFTAWQYPHSTDIDEIKAGLAIFEAEVDEIVSGITDDMTTREKYIYLASEVSVRTEYDYSLGQPGVATACGAIMGGYSICQGYADIYQYLCKKADLYCVTVEGESMDSVAHAWNIIALPGGTYHVDVTWMDIAGASGSVEWMKYFGLTQEEILVDHIQYGDIIATGK